MKKVKTTGKGLLRAFIPLSARKRLCIWINSAGLLDRDLRYWWTMELLRDLMEGDKNEFHRFLWSNHLGYASSYELEERFGTERIKGSRLIFFAELERALYSLGVDPGKDVRSAFEVGCSLGYQLRHLETGLFASAEVLEGNDIDAYAVEKGMGYLKSIGSKVRIHREDMTSLGRLLGGRTFDVMICTGVLMYLDENQASKVVGVMLDHCNTLAAISGLADPDTDNGRLDRSRIRKDDGSFIHNIDRMVTDRGWVVVGRRYGGKRMVDGHSIYFVYAARPAS